MLRRRAFLQSGTGLGGIALASLLQRESQAAPILGQPHFPPRAKNVIFLFMAGAPSQLDLFTPKPELTRLNETGFQFELPKLEAALRRELLSSSASGASGGSTALNL